MDATGHWKSSFCSQGRELIKIFNCGEIRLMLSSTTTFPTNTMSRFGKSELNDNADCRGHDFERPWQLSLISQHCIVQLVCASSIVWENCEEGLGASVKDGTFVVQTKTSPVRRSYDMFIEHLTRGREQKKQQNSRVNAKFYTSTLLTGAHLKHEFKHAGDTSVQAQVHRAAGRTHTANRQGILGRRILDGAPYFRIGVKSQDHPINASRCLRMWVIVKETLRDMYAHTKKTKIDWPNQGKKDKEIVEQNCLNQQIVGYCSQKVAPTQALQTTRERCSQPEVLQHV